jgi:hypothetical protein
MATHADSPMLTAALRYAELGYAIFACRPGTKLPATGHGVLDGTFDPERLRQWWSRQTDRNIGLACTGILVVDIDPGGLAWPGDDARRQSIKATGCPLQQTPRGGFHLVFGIPTGCHWRCSVGLLAPGVDTRTGGGYIVVAPSVVKGKPYRWIRPLVRKEELPLPPDWLVEALDALEHKRQKPSQKGNGPQAQETGLLLEGRRNAGLASLAGRLRRSGLSEAELLAALLTANKQRCCPPLPEKEVAAIAKSIAKYAPGPVESCWAMREAWKKAIEHRRRRYAHRTHF